MHFRIAFGTEKEEVIKLVASTIWFKTKPKISADPKKETEPKPEKSVSNLV